MDTINNRELSWMLFNERVLQEAQDENVPLMERLRFLGIFSNNQDEFFKVRVANQIRYAELKTKRPLMIGEYTPSQLLSLVNKRIVLAQGVFRKTYIEILSEMEKHGVRVVNEHQITPKQQEFCNEYFFSVVSSRIVPLMIRKRMELPFLPDGKIYLAVKMSGVSSKTSKYAILQMPVSEACPRFVVLPSAKGQTDIIFLDDIVRLFLDDIFFMFNYKEISAHTFKLMRDAEVTIDDDVSKSMVEKISQSITDRKHGRPIRLIYDREMPEDVLEIISKKLGLRLKEQLEASGRYHMMRDLMKFPKVRAKLENVNPKPLLHPAIDPFNSIINVIKKQDLLVCYPYQTFKHVIDLLREAAVDPRVESIYITLYRTAQRSKVVNVLCNAAKNGKKVTVLLELKARFDEEQNLDNTDLLQTDGVKVIHSVNGLKVHSKLLLIERTEGVAGLKGYVYVGTGNFNEDTSRVYSDFGVFTAHQGIVQDARKIFDFLINAHKHPQFKHLIVSPYYMRDEFESLINVEIKNAQKGKKAYIDAKFNSLTDEKMIAKLYKASAAGVKIRLLIRGACCLRPQVKGLSENIQARSIVDKYLEHSRLIIYCNAGDPRSIILSADWMNRNLDRRVEVGIPILDKKIHQTLEEIFEIAWNDNVKSRNLANFERNEYISRAPGALSHRSQEDLYELFKNLKNG